MRASTRLSFDDEESLTESAGSLRFDNPSLASDPNTSSMPPQPEDRNEDICLDDFPSDPNTLQRMGSTSSVPPQERDDSEDIQVCHGFNNPPSPSDLNTLRRTGSTTSSSMLPQGKSEDT